MNEKALSVDFLDRVSMKRNDKDWIDTQFMNASTRIIPVWDSKNLCTRTPIQGPIYPTPSDLHDYSNARESSVFLGVRGKRALFAVDIDSSDYAYALCERKNAEFLNLRQVVSLLDHMDSTLLALARFMVLWNSRNRFCGKCGNPTRTADAGNLRICTNARCEQHHFPSMDPAIIVLVSRGDSCLLGRQQVWQKGRYSTIAGFVEPGESIEDAVVREVREETGVEVGDIKYQSSQPWLFPSSLMLGFTATAKSNEIRIDKNELEDARWFSREEIKNNLKKGLMLLPSRASIAYALIKAWYMKGNLGELDAA